MIREIWWHRDSFINSPRNLQSGLQGRFENNDYNLSRWETAFTDRGHTISGTKWEVKDTQNSQCLPFTTV